MKKYKSITPISADLIIPPNRPWRRAIGPLQRHCYTQMELLSFSLSPRERVGVRGKGSSAGPTFTNPPRHRPRSGERRFVRACIEPPWSSPSPPLEERQGRGGRCFVAAINDFTFPVRSLRSFAAKSFRASRAVDYCVISFESPITTHESPVTNRPNLHPTPAKSNLSPPKPYLRISHDG